MQRLERGYVSIFNYASTAARARSRLIMTVNARISIPLATRDVTRANFCTTHTLLREVYVEPTSEADTGPDGFCLLRRALWRLSDAAIIFYATYARDNRTKLGIRHTTTDPSVFICHTDDGPGVGRG